MPSGHEGGGDEGGGLAGGRDGGGSEGAGTLGGGLAGLGEDGGSPGGGGGRGTIGCAMAVMWLKAVTWLFSRQHRYHSPSGSVYVPWRFGSKKLVNSGAIGPTVHSAFVVFSQKHMSNCSSSCPPTEKSMVVCWFAFRCTVLSSVSSWVGSGSPGGSTPITCRMRCGGGLTGGGGLG
jgi:hypothetical protein